MNKRNYKIEQHLVQHFKYYSECSSYPPPLPLFATPINNSFLSSFISINHEKGLKFQPIVWLFYSLLFLKCKISFKRTYKTHKFHYFPYSEFWKFLSYIHDYFFRSYIHQLLANSALSNQYKVFIIY